MDASIGFLDIPIPKGTYFEVNNILDIIMYHKKINTFLFITSHSFHPKQMDKNFILSKSNTIH